MAGEEKDGGLGIIGRGVHGRTGVVLVKMRAKGRRW